MSAMKPSTSKRRSESDVSNMVARMRDEDDLFDTSISFDTEGSTMYALYRITEKDQKCDQTKKEELISSLASEIKSMLDKLKFKIEESMTSDIKFMELKFKAEDRRTFSKALSKSSKECENTLKKETTFQALNEKFGTAKATYLQSLEDIISKFVEENGRLFVRWQPPNMGYDAFSFDEIKCLLAISYEREHSHGNQGNRGNDVGFNEPERHDSSHEIHSVASEIKSMLDRLKFKIEESDSATYDKKSMLDELKLQVEDRIIFSKALSKSIKECENSSFQALHEKFCQEKAVHLQSLEDIISKFVEEKGRLFVRWQPSNMGYNAFSIDEIECLLANISHEQEHSHGNQGNVENNIGFNEPKRHDYTHEIHRFDEPFVLSKTYASQTHTSQFYEIYYRGDGSTVRVNLSHGFNLTEWVVAGHDYRSGWVLAVKEKTVAYYTVLEHISFVLPEEAPLMAPIEADNWLGGCFSGHPEAVNTVTMLVDFAVNGVHYHRYSKGMGWVSEFYNSGNEASPNAMVSTNGNYVWADMHTRVVYVIEDWADTLLPLRITEIPFPQDFPAADVALSSAVIGIRVLFIWFSENDDELLEVRRLKLKNGVWTFKPMLNFKGHNVYVANQFTGFGVKPTRSRVPPIDPVPTNVLFMAGGFPSHCSSYHIHDMETEDEKECFSPVMQRTADGEEMPLCGCMSVWFNIQL